MCKNFQFYGTICRVLWERRYLKIKRHHMRILYPFKVIHSKRQICARCFISSGHDFKTRTITKLLLYKSVLGKQLNLQTRNLENEALINLRQGVLKRQKAERANWLYFSFQWMCNVVQCSFIGQSTAIR